MDIGDYSIPEGWESMTCIYNCGFVLVWELGSPEGTLVLPVMTGHLEQHKTPRPSLRDWFTNRKGK